MAGAETADGAHDDDDEILDREVAEAEEETEAAGRPTCCPSRRSPTTWSASCARTRRWSARPATSTTRPRTSARSRTDMLMPKKVKHRKTQRGRLDGRRQGRHLRLLRRLRDPGAGARVAHRAPDRGSPYRHDPPRQAWRQGLDPGLPRQADHPEAGRDPHGLGQGQPRAVGRRRAPRPHPVRAGRRRRAPGASAAMERAIQKLPFKARFVVRPGTHGHPEVAV